MPSPPPRSKTPQRNSLVGASHQPVTGSLAGGPPPRRSSTASPDPSLQLLNARRHSSSVRLAPLTSIMNTADVQSKTASASSSPRQVPSSSSPATLVASQLDADQAFLHDLLQLPPSRRREALLKSAPMISSPPSSNATVHTDDKALVNLPTTFED